MKVFLGGTCNESTWRNDLIKLLEKNHIDYFNPVVDDWDEKAFKRELQEKKICDCHLYVITPRMTGVYSIAEVVDDSNKMPEGTVFCVIPTDGNRQFTYGQLKSLDKVGEMVKMNKGHYVPNYDDLINVLITMNNR